MLEIVVFLCGAAVMVLEMVGSRILAPYLGTSIVVWTSLIGIILGALSLGYWWGGRIADKRPDYRSFSCVILLAAFFIALISISKTFILTFLQSASGSVHTASIAATLILFAPPSILLGMVSPYAVRLSITDACSSGKVAGRLYALSTAGSIIGTFLAGFFLIAFFGSTNILLIISAVLVIASFTAYRGDERFKAACLGLTLAFFIISGYYDADLAAKGIYDLDTDYNRILIYHSRDEPTDLLTVNMSTGPDGRQSASFVDDPYRLVIGYTKYYRFFECLRPQARNTLMLGGGGYSFPKYLIRNHPQVSMDVVEIDPGITDTARRFFDFNRGPNVKVIHEDARTFLNKNMKKYDVIFMDVFNSHYSVPFHLATAETVKRLHDALTDDGMVVMNILSALEGREGLFFQAEYATFALYFPKLKVYAVSNPEDRLTRQNIMLLAFKTAKNTECGTGDEELTEFKDNEIRDLKLAGISPLTDEFAPVDYYTSIVKLLPGE